MDDEAPRNNIIAVQGRTEELKGGVCCCETEGGGRILRKINCFCEILNKMSLRGGAKDRRPPPLCTPMLYENTIVNT